MAEKHCLVHENALGVFFFYGRFFLIRKKQAFCEVLTSFAKIRINLNSLLLNKIRKILILRKAREAVKRRKIRFGSGRVFHGRIFIQSCKPRVRTFKRRLFAGNTISDYRRPCSKRSLRHCGQVRRLYIKRKSELSESFHSRRYGLQSQKNC